MAFNGIWHTSFTIADIDRSIKFYTEVLGLEVMNYQIQHNEYTAKLVGYEGANLKVAMLRIPSAFVGPSNHHLELVEYVHPRGEPTDVSTNRPGAPHLAFVTDDIFADYARMKEMGVRFRAPEPVAIEAGINKGGYTVYFLDPDDITLEMLQPPAGRLWGSVDGVEVKPPHAE
ncbi:MAG: VOC family protein [Fimbriimonadaceae bacterium]|nr:VOC family protein [Fimbriimonadaceae bacterium]